MFEISWGELLLIGAVALIVIGPKELPTVLRTVGQWVTKVRRMAAEFQGQFQEATREAELSDLKKQVDEMVDPTKSSIYNPVEVAKKEVESAFAEADKTTAPAAAAATPEVSVPPPAEAPPLPAELGGAQPSATPAPAASDAL